MFQRSVFVCHAMMLTCTFDHCVTSMATVRFWKKRTRCHTTKHKKTKDKNVEIYI